MLQITTTKALNNLVSLLAYTSQYKENDYTTIRVLAAKITTRIDGPVFKTVEVRHLLTMVSSLLDV